VNAGSTKQNGIEGLLKYQLIKNQNGFLKALTFMEQLQLPTLPF
jgi:hypothetical protein